LGLINDKEKSKRPKNFKDWIFTTFGRGIAYCFMLPYNKKIWAYPLNKLSKDWIANRVSKIDIGKLIENVVYNRSDDKWGPNSKFIYPLRGGVAGLFLAMALFFKDKLHLNKKLTSIDIEKKKLRFNNKEEVDYDMLISTIPLDKLIKLTKVKELYKHADSLKHNSILVVGIGLNKKSPSNKGWMYFPEDNCPFYRVTYLSNYSPQNIPGKEFYSLMCETSYSHFKSVNKKDIFEQTIQGLINTKLIEEKDRKNIISKYLIDREYSYPIPTIDRDKALRTINHFLESKDIYSRGRFGLWKYEIGNMDHSVMQGVGIVNKLVSREPEVIK
jgi:protoporphyrinogen oxidase